MRAVSEKQLEFLRSTSISVPSRSGAFLSQYQCVLAQNVRFRSPGALRPYETSEHQRFPLGEALMLGIHRCTLVCETGASVKAFRLGGCSVRCQSCPLESVHTSALAEKRVHAQKENPPRDQAPHAGNRRGLVLHSWQCVRSARRTSSMRETCQSTTSAAAASAGCQCGRWYKCSASHAISSLVGAVRRTDSACSARGSSSSEIDAGVHLFRRVLRAEGETCRQLSASNARLATR